VSDALKTLLTARQASNAAFDAAIAALGGAADAAHDDPLTAPLGPYGEWGPSWLKAKADAAAAKYPNGFGEGTEIGPDGKPRIAQFAWPSHFVWSGALVRTDLTEQQRLTLLYADQQGVGQGILNAGADTPAWQPFITVTRGPWTALVNGQQVHADLDELRAETERYFARYLGV
jgi:hypothetical protein